MRGFKWSGGVVLVLAALGYGRAADDTLDLRGPAPQKGQEYVTKSELKIKGADVVVKTGAETVKLKLTLHALLEEELTVLDVNGRDVTKYQTKILRDRTETSGADKDVSHTETLVLERETVLGTRDGKKWLHVLASNQPTEKQTKELRDRGGFENRDELYPSEKVKVGHAWTADAAVFNRVLNNSLTEPKGKLDQKFARVEDLDGEKVAVIESSGKITGKMKQNGEPALNATLELKLTTWKSLKTGAVVREKFEGKIDVSGTMKDGTTTTEMTLVGPISAEITTKPIERKK